MTFLFLLLHQLHLRSSGTRSQRLGTSDINDVDACKASQALPVGPDCIRGEGSMGLKWQKRIITFNQHQISLKDWAAAATAAKSLQLCPTLCDPMDCSPPGSSVHGILQARTLEWVALSFSNA